MSESLIPSKSKRLRLDNGKKRDYFITYKVNWDVISVIVEFLQIKDICKSVLPVSKYFFAPYASKKHKKRLLKDIVRINYGDKIFKYPAVTNAFNQSSNVYINSLIKNLCNFKTFAIMSAQYHNNNNTILANHHNTCDICQKLVHSSGNETYFNEENNKYICLLYLLYLQKSNCLFYWFNNLRLIVSLNKIEAYWAKSNYALIRLNNANSKKRNNYNKSTKRIANINLLQFCTSFNDNEFKLACDLQKWKETFTIKVRKDDIDEDYDPNENEQKKKFFFDKIKIEHKLNLRQIMFIAYDLILRKRIDLCLWYLNFSIQKNKVINCNEVRASDSLAFMYRYSLIGFDVLKPNPKWELKIKNNCLFDSHNRKPFWGKYLTFDAISEGINELKNNKQLIRLLQKTFMVFLSCYEKCDQLYLMKGFYESGIHNEGHYKKSHAKKWKYLDRHRLWDIDKLCLDFAKTVISTEEELALARAQAKQKNCSLTKAVSNLMAKLYPS